MTFEETVAHMTSDVDSLKSIYQTEKALWASKEAALLARIAELEADGDGGDVDPPPPVNAPKILVELWDGTKLDTNIYFLDKTAPEFAVVGGGNLTLTWKATSDLSNMRAQLVMKAVPGGGGTARRDPIGSERWYGFGIFLPQDGYSFEDQWANEKCVTGQWHQGGENGIVNPPLSIEQIKTSADGEIMRLVLSLKDKERKVFQLGRPPRTAANMLFHIRWSAGGDGFIGVWRDGVEKVSYQGATCNGVTTEGLNPMLSNYNPGRKGGAFVTGYKRVVVYTYWRIGDQTNVLGDFAELAKKGVVTLTRGDGGLAFAEQVYGGN
jgi:hypothetical protein